MNRKIFSCLVLASGLFVLLCVPRIASADDVTWDLSGVTFTDGGTATGSFVYNADTNTLSSINIVTSSGTAFGGADYTATDPGGYGPFSNELLFVTSGSGDLTGTPALDLIFDSNLTDSGGTVGLSLLSGELTCGDAGCDTGGDVFYRAISGGDVTAAVSTPTVHHSAAGLRFRGVVRRVKA